MLYHAQGRYAKAEPLYQRALAIREKALGPEHPDVATSLNNLAALYHAPRPIRQGRAALSALTRHPGEGPRPRASRRGQSLNNLAVLYDAQGQYAKAEPLYQRALAIAEKALGPEHPNVATFRTNYAASRRAAGRGAEADALEAWAVSTAAKPR